MNGRTSDLSRTRSAKNDGLMKFLECPPVKRERRFWRGSKGDSHRRIPPFNSEERGSRSNLKGGCDRGSDTRRCSASSLSQALSAATLSNPGSTISRLTSKLDPGSRIAPGTNASLRSTSINFVSTSS